MTPMKRSPMVLAIVLVVGAFVLGGLGLVAWSPTLTSIALPVSKHGKPWRETDVVMTVCREAPVCLVGGDGIRAASDPWEVTTVVCGESFATSTRLRGDPVQASLRRMRLREVAAAKASSGSREATCAIRFPANTPYEVVSAVLVEVLEAARFPTRYEVAFAVTAGGSSEQLLFDVPLPEAGPGFMGREPAEVVVALATHPPSGEEARYVQYRAEGLSPGEPLILRAGEVLPVGANGDAELETVLRDLRRREPDVVASIGPRGDAPLQAVVDVMDVMRAAGFERIGFFLPVRD